MPDTAAAEHCYTCRGETRARSVGSTAMVVCTRCGTGHLGTDQRAPDYWSRHDDPRGELTDRYWTEARTTVFRTVLRQLEGHGRPGRVLDLGGGVGHFTECALERGWDAYSLDVSEWATEAAARTIGADRALSSVPQELYGTCDAVTLWCVVAHLRDPRVMLEEAVRLLKPHGRLFLTTPNFLFQAKYAWFRTRLGRPLDFVAEDHVLHFTPKALDLLLEGAGLSPLTYTYAGVTEDCLFDRRMATLLVPVKRVWNFVGVAVSHAGMPPLSSELQVVGVKATTPGA